MAQILSPLFAVFKFHKLKLIFVLLIASVFIVILFPNDDLADMISAQVGRSGLYLRLESLGFKILPSPGVGADKITIEPQGLPALKAGAFEAHVALGKILLARAGFTAMLSDLFKGKIDLDYGQGSTSKSGARFDDVTLTAERLSLDDLCDYLRAAGLFGFRLQGTMGLNTEMHLDQGFADQPSGSIKATFPQLTIPSQTVMLDMNGVAVQQQLPTLELGNVSLDAKLNEGVMEISSAKLGGMGKEINGTIKGTLGLLFNKLGNGVSPQPSNLDLSMDLTIDQAFLDRNKGTVIGGFLILMDPYKETTAKGTRYAIRLQMKQFMPGAMPIITKIDKKS